MFKLPNSAYSDYYDSARFELTWRIITLLIVVLSVLDIGFYFVEPRFVLHYSIGLVLLSLSAVYLKFYGKYKPIAIFISITAFFLVVSSLLFLPEAIHYIEPFWMILITLYAYFVLGKWWGSVLIFGEIASVVIYFVFFLNRNIQEFKLVTLGQSVTMSIEFSVCLILLGYIIHQFIVTNRYAEEKLKLTNDALLSEKDLVEKQNKEKTVLLQEIHHRVKNNLQVVTSLLRIQSNKLTNEEAKSNFQDAINRIMTMALIHQKMYERENLSEIEIKDYFRDLMNDLKNVGMAENEIHVEFDINIERIGSKTIVPLALMINELTTNSIKHAVPDKGNLEIHLGLNESSNGKILMSYSDNGTWVESNSDESFGLQLIETFTEQLEGDFERKTSSGKTSYQFVLTDLEVLN